MLNNIIIRLMFLLDFSKKTKILYLKENIPSSKCFNDYQHIIDIIYVLFLLVSDFFVCSGQKTNLCSSHHYKTRKGNAKSF